MLIINNDFEEKKNTSDNNSKNYSKENSGNLPFVKIDNKEDFIYNDLNKNKDIKIIDLRNNKTKLFVFNKTNIRKKYVKDDLCLQNVYEFAYLSKVGMINFKNLYSYEDNIAYNEIPLIYYEKENNSSSSTSLNNVGALEGTVANYILRDSVLLPMLKRNSAMNNIPSIPSQKSFNSSALSIGQGSSHNSNSVLSLNKNNNGGVALNSYLMFEESDNSSYDEEFE